MARSYPVNPLEEALTVAQAIQDSNAGMPFDRILLAKALGTTPMSSVFTKKLISSARYGLTAGSSGAARIVLTDNGRAAVASTSAVERRRALLNAATAPQLFGKFYHMLQGKRMPEKEFALNLLHRELGVRPELTGECLRLLTANAQFVGILREVGGAWWVTLETQGLSEPNVAPTPAAQANTSNGARVFLGHADNAHVIKFLSSLMGELGIGHDWAEGGTDDGRPIPGGVAQAMKGCTGAVLVFSNAPNSTAPGAEGVASERMRFLLGAASALYGQRVVLMKETALALDGRTAGVATVPFEPDRLAEAGLALMLEMHRVGIISVTGLP